MNLSNLMPPTQLLQPVDLPMVNIPDSDDKKKKVAQDFEAVFLNHMMQSAFSTVDVDPLFGGGHAEELWRGELIRAVTQLMAEGDSLGIAQSVYDQLMQDAERTTS